MPFKNNKKKYLSIYFLLGGTLIYHPCKEWLKYCCLPLIHLVPVIRPLFTNLSIQITQYCSNNFVMVKMVEFLVIQLPILLCPISLLFKNLCISNYMFSYYEQTVNTPIKWNINHWVFVTLNPSNNQQIS